MPVLADAEGEVVWIPGVARSSAQPDRGTIRGGEAFPIGIG
jgi:hypothetical protein